MPVTQSAKKALRRDQRRQSVNQVIKARIRSVIKAANKNEPNEEKVNQAYSVLDRAAKKKVLHPNTAARYKSAVAKSIKTIEKKPRKAKA